MSPETILPRNREIIAANLQIAEDFFDDHRDLFIWMPPAAGSIAFPLWKGHLTIENFCQGLLEKHGVMVVPGSIFDYPGNYFRVGLGRKNFPEALQHVGEYLEELR